MLQAQAALSCRPPEWTLPAPLRESFEPAFVYEPAARPSMAVLHERLASLAESSR